MLLRRGVAAVGAAAVAHMGAHLREYSTQHAVRGFFVKPSLEASFVCKYIR